MTAASVEVSVRGLFKRFGAVDAVSGIDFDVVAGEMFGLIGPDGAGKTTTLRMVLGLLHADAGDVTTCGLAPERERRALSRRVGYLAQRFSLYGDLSVDENVAFFGRVHGVRRWKPRRDELLDLLRLAPFRDRLGERLSGGMKQKLALACTLIHTPRLLVLDEPTTGVDPVSRRDFWRILSRLRREGMTILLTTPYLDEAERCTRVALMDRGRILTSDTPEALRRTSSEAMVELVARPTRRARELLAADPGVTTVQIYGERLHAGVGSADPTAEAGRLAALLREAGIEVEGARPIVPSLEDVFIARVRDDAGASARGEVA